MTVVIKYGVIYNVHQKYTMCHFTFWISLLLKPKTETKRLKFGLSPELGLTNRRSATRWTFANVITDVIADIAVFLCLSWN